METTLARYKEMFEKTVILNTTLEKVKWQCDGSVYIFEPRSETKIPQPLAQFLNAQCGFKGLVALPPMYEKGDQSWRMAERAGLLSYLSGALSERKRNYEAQMDEYKKRGVTLDESPRYKECIRWMKEIRHKLEMEAPIEEELSFLESEERKKLGIDGAKIINFSDKFSGLTKATASNTTEEDLEKQEVPTSFDDLDCRITITEDIFEKQTDSQSSDVKPKRRGRPPKVANVGNK